MEGQAEWKIVPSVAPGEYGVTIVDERGEIVASTYREHAPLLRAAPAVVAALREFVAAFDDPTTTDAHRNVLVELGLDGWLHEAHAALAKAEGREP